MLAVLLGSIAGALLRYLMALAPVASSSPLRTIVISGVGGAILGTFLGLAMTTAFEGAGRWLITILLAAAIASFGAISVLTAAVEAPLRDSLINIAATVIAAAVAAGTIYRVPRT